MGAPLATIPLVNAIVFWAYGDAKRVFTATEGLEANRAELPLWQMGVAGAYAGFVNAFVVSPMELVKVQLQGQAADGVGPRYYKGPLDWCKQAYRTAGFRPLLQGLTPTVIREIPAYAAQFFAYEVRGAA